MAAPPPSAPPPALLRLRLEHDAVLPLSALLAGPHAPDALDAACGVVRSDLRRAVERATASSGGGVLLSGGALLFQGGADAASPVTLRLARSQAAIPAGLAGLASPRSTKHLWQALATPVAVPLSQGGGAAAAAATAAASRLPSPADRLVSVPITLDVAVPLPAAGAALAVADSAPSSVATVAVPRRDVEAAVAAAHAALQAQVGPAADELRRALAALAAAAHASRLPGDDEDGVDAAAAADVAAAAAHVTVGALHSVVPSSSPAAAAGAGSAGKAPPQLVALTKLASHQQPPLALVTAVYGADWLAPPRPPAPPPGATVAQRASAKRMAALRRANAEDGDRLTAARRALHAHTRLPTGAPLFRVACALGLGVAALTESPPAKGDVPAPALPAPKKPAFSLDDSDDDDEGAGGASEEADAALAAAALAASDVSGSAHDGSLSSGAAALPATVPLTDGALRQLLQRAGVPVLATTPSPSLPLPLRDVHVGLPPPVPRAARPTTTTTAAATLRLATVAGGYEYHHYGQGPPPSDAGWGCAYRSAQTLASWLRCCGWVPPGATIPSHRDLQQALVDCGDQPPGGGLVGSTRWIGSAEVGAALAHLCGVACRTVHCRTGAELATVGAAELLRHFGGGGGGGGELGVATSALPHPSSSSSSSSLPRSLPLGCPVMMGGGSLAFTLLGVAVAEEDAADAGAASAPAVDRVWLLTLDPHFVGSDDPGPPDAAGDDAAGDNTATATAESVHGGLPPDPAALLAARWSRRPGPEARARLQGKPVAMQGGYRAAPVSWRPVSSFAGDVFYNLCIPQRPEALV